MITMENSTTALMEIDVGNSKMSFQTFLESQKDLFHSQIDQLQKIVVTQCKLTGVNPLSQEMAAGALSINIGKRPRDLLNPKAVKYMQSVFSIKDTISKKESREISALCGVTITQVREYFASQRSRVRKHVRLAREKATKSDVSKTSLDVCSTSSDPAMLVMDPAPLNSVDPAPLNSMDPAPLNSVNPAPLNSMDPAPLNSVDPAPLNSMDPSPLSYVDPAPLNSVNPKAVEEAPSCSSQQETIPGIDASDKIFVDSIFNLMRKEETFSGQMKLMEWILQIQNPSVLNWFLTKEGLMILTVWLSQAAVEEQTTVLHVVLKVLCHLPLHKALPFQVSAIIQNVNRLRFYRTSDISNRAKVLLTRLSKILIRNAALKKPSPNSLNDAHKETIHKKRTRLMIENQWQSNIDLPEDVLALTLESSENCRKSEPQQALKMLTASADDSTRENNRGVSSSQTRERRKVLLVEQPGRNTNGRSGQVARAVTSNHARPMSADDIKKAKMRAMFMQGKYGKSVASSNESRQPKIEVPKRPSLSQTSHLVSAPKSPVRPEIEENSNPAVLATKTSPTLLIAETSPTLRIAETSATLPIAKTTTTPPIAETSPTLPQAPIDSKLSLGPPEPSLEKLKRDQISWQMPPEVIVNNLWSVGAGENSKEVEIQTGRIRREKETIYQRIQDIPSNPKDPWDREMDYDDTLTPEIPTEQPPDAVEISSSPRYNATMAVASTSASNPLPITPISTAGSDNLPEPDLELLAVLLKNPELVFALTSGQGSNLTSADTVRLLDMIKTNGINLSGVSNGLGGNPSGKAEVMTSLPSPTPPSEPRMTQWRSEVANDGFSQPSLVGARESSVFSVAAATSTIPSLSGQLPAAVATHLVQPQTSTTNYLPQLPVNTTSTHHLRAINPEDHLYTGLNPHSTQLLGINQVQQQQPTISSLHQNNLVAAGLPLLHQETVNYGQIHNVKAAPISIHINPPKDMPSALLPTPPQRQQQQQTHLLSEQQMLQPFQTGWQWNNPVSHNSSRQNGYEGSSVSNPGLYQSNQNNNYNVYPPVGQLRTPPYLPGSTTWERNNEYMDETDLETWSPERSFGYQSSSGFYSTEPRRGSGGRNWSSGRRRDSDGFRDNRGGGRGGGRRWRGRRH